MKEKASVSDQNLTTLALPCGELAEGLNAPVL
jgi:hypothetical protein